MSKKCIHLWFPNIIENKGGIQVYLNFLLQAFQENFPDIQFEVFLKHDRPVIVNNLNTQNTKFYCTGNWPLFLRTPAFAAEITSQGIWQKPDLIISTHVNFTSVAYWLKSLGNIPYWTIAHGVEVWHIQQASLLKGLLNSDRILSVSGYTRDLLLKHHNLEPEKISLLPCTFDENSLQIAAKPNYLLQRYGLQPEQPTILTVARLASSEQHKGYDKILAALPQIRQVIPNVHYVLVGKGDDRPRIEQLIKQLNLQNYVTLTGFIPDSEIVDHYNLCDVFAMPSKQEGFGIVYLEALACGKPTLGGDRDGAIDALCHGELGVLVNPDRPSDIAQSLINILSKTHPNPIIYQPEILRQKVIEYYGIKQFQKTLARQINNFFNHS